MAAKMTTANFFNQMQEIHYCRLDSQSNIYGLAKFSVSSAENKLLVASLRGRVMNVAFQKTVPSSREVNFTYIPNDAEIISLDAFNRTSPEGLIVAISFMKVNNCRYLNIYSDFETSGELDLDSIALGCQSLDLNFVPYQLYHTEIHLEGEVETVLLLSGGDIKIHMFREAKNTHMFVEEQIDEYFPELVDLPGIVIWLQCACVGTKRLTAIGCQNGFVAVSLVDLTSKAVLRTFKIQHDSPITSVNLFTLNSHSQSAACDISHPKDEDSTSEILPEYHLVVTSALELAVVYANVFNRGLVGMLVLPESDAFDCVLCSLVADVDFDGTKEILLGTYGQELLLYKFQSKPVVGHSAAKIAQSADPITPAASVGSRPMADDNHSSDAKTLQDGEFVLVARRSLPDPVFALDQLDMTGDGLEEIIVLSLRGVHVLQHDLTAATELCLRRLKLSNSNSLRNDAQPGVSQLT